MRTHDDAGPTPVEVLVLAGKDGEQRTSFIATPGVLAFN
jgi:hypothetical protein